MAPQLGLEPKTLRLTAARSTIELLRHIARENYKPCTHHPHSVYMFGLTWATLRGFQCVCSERHVPTQRIEYLLSWLYGVSTRTWTTETSRLSSVRSNQLSYTPIARVVYRDTSSSFHICKRFELFIGSDPKHLKQMIFYKNITIFL